MGIREEVVAALRFVFDVYDLLGFHFGLVLSTRPKKAMGDQELWDEAEAQLRSALDACGRTWTLNEGDGAFYGPKIDIELKDALGRPHQCGTIQLDFNLPLRFNLRYQTGETGELGFARPVILHRAILGSVERMVAVLAEHFGGKWPFWLSPRQCAVVPVSEDAFGYARYVRDAFHQRGFHVDAMLGGDTLKKKVRDAQVAQWNYILVVGKNEEESMSVNVRVRGNPASLGSRSLKEMLDSLEEENKPGALKRTTHLEPFCRKDSLS